MTGWSIWKNSMSYKNPIACLSQFIFKESGYHNDDRGRNFRLDFMKLKWNNKKGTFQICWVPTLDPTTIESPNSQANKEVSQTFLKVWEIKWNLLYQFGYFLP